MKKLRKKVVNAILQKWPDAQVFPHSETVINDCEVNIVYTPNCFITIYENPLNELRIICALVKLDEKNVYGYNCFQEYEINVQGTNGKHKTTYYNATDSSQVWNAEWSINELIDHIRYEFEVILAKHRD